MKAVQLHFEISDDMKLKNVIINFNDTGLPSDKELIKNLANAMLTSFQMDDTADEAVKIINTKRKNK